MLLGLLLVLVCWPLSWGLSGLRTHLLFFPLWLGYVLVVDAWCEVRSGTSAWVRSRSSFVRLFVVSSAAWWLFEAANLRLRNWEYLGRERFSDLEYGLLASLSFSTVLPAVLGTAELLLTLPIVERQGHWKRWELAPGKRPLLAAGGALALALTLAWPRVFFPLVWGAGVLLLEPLALALGRPSLTGPLARGDGRRWIALPAAGLVCGFFWELWNAYSFPKWIYHIPGVPFAKVFEMPLLGYLGYLPFALEVFLLASLASPRFVRGLEQASALRGAQRAGNEPG